MDPTAPAWQLIRHQEHQYFRLLLSLGVLGALYPLLDLGEVGLWCWYAAFFVVAYSALLTQRKGGRGTSLARVMLVMTIALGVVALVWGLFEHESYDLVVPVAANAVSVAYLAQIIVCILLDVLARGTVTIDKIFGAVCVYVLMGLMWAFFYGLLFPITEDFLVPVARRSGHPLFAPDAMDSLQTRLYFSFVTLTTVGYGDIAPGNTVARLLTTFEAVGGQLYLTILVARLIGLHISHSQISPDIDPQEEV